MKFLELKDLLLELEFLSRKSQLTNGNQHWISRLDVCVLHGQMYKFFFKLYKSHQTYVGQMRVIFGTKGQQQS